MLPVRVTRPTLERFDGVLPVLQAADVAVYGATDWIETELRDEWDGRFHQTGETTGALGVVSENPTGALRLDEHTGMRVLWQADVWHKELRAVG